MIKTIFTANRGDVDVVFNVPKQDLNKKLREHLLIGVVHFSFIKKDGTLRDAYGTLKTELITTPSGEGLKSNIEATATYYDIEVKAWRSYVIENLIAIY